MDLASGANAAPNAAKGMAGADLFKGLVGLFGGIQKSDALSAEEKYTHDQLLLNEDLASERSKQAIAQGEFEQGIQQGRTAQMVGGQKASGAAEGIDVNTGTSKIIQEQTAEIGGKDFATIGNNAWMKSLGYQIEGENEAIKDNSLAFENKKRETMFGAATGLYSNVMRAYSDLDQRDKSNA
jgi:hypothetical protein